MHFDLQKLIWVGIVVLMVLSLVELWSSGQRAATEISLSQALSDIKDKKVETVEVYSERLVLTYKGEDKIATSRKEAGESFTEILDRTGINPTEVHYEIKDETIGQILISVLPSLLGTVVVIFVLLYMFRQARGAQDSIFSFGQSKAKLFDKGKQSVNFADVAGGGGGKKKLEEK